MRIRNLHITCLFVLLITTLGCKKEDEAFLGPELGAASDSFSITTAFSADQTTVDFTTDVVRFWAVFNEKVTWTITITGDDSGAEYMLSGTGTEIDSALVQWDGSTENQILFRNESCTAVLTVLASDSIWSLPINIIERKEYGTLWQDFEDPLPGTWYPASSDVGDVMNTGIETFPTPDGTSVFALSGTDNNESYYIGNVGENLQTTGSPFNTGTTDPDELYFNVFIYGYGASNKAKLEFQFTEDDNGDGFPGWSTEDNYILTFEADQLTYEGWKLHSIRYSDIVNQYTVGNQIQQPDKIIALAILLTSVPQGNTVSAKIDHPVFTVGEPLFGFQ